MQRRLHFCGRCFYKVKKLPGLLPGRVAFLCKGARANVRGATLLMQRHLSICWSGFTTCAWHLHFCGSCIYKVTLMPGLLQDLQPHFGAAFRGFCPLTTRVSGEGSRLPGARESTRGCVCPRKSSRYLSCQGGTTGESPARTRRARRRCSPGP